ncbi:flagellar hook assembly protein FlgD [Oceanibaculum indicum]|uniref:Basal-body rod modification protein FlgD n=2 Tax=Oceanibaculum indicum TaxID=526216 RepID=K2JEA9_9PROT|nr:flagellar hook capping FlgD N-terminal domain-containing protein [Oceanibaculum indicum]EKE68954.1 flagellar basal-body rod modification protein FlgD [Oceanibaculum indicum P24]RKQ73796.1 flagellar basal-body rod modification protein FlgD [Oceanibaculum indicum]
MAVDGVSGTSTTTATRDSSISQAQLADNFDTFLTLLTTQLRNQDPLNPMDTHEFTNQLVLFSGVEQQIRQNQNLESLIALQVVGEQASAMTYIGKYVTAESQIAALQEGEANWTYVLPEGAISNTLRVVDSEGNVVRTLDGEYEAGRHDFTWDGKDDAGNPLPDGAYALRVSALDRDGKAVSAAIGMTSRVTGVSKDPDGLGPVLSLGDGLNILLDKVISVKESAA